MLTTQFRHLLIAFCACVLGSCTTYSATVKSAQKWNYGVMKVTPSWTSSNMQEMPFSLEDSEEWVSKFNKENRLHYVLVKKDLDHTLLLAPNATLTTVRADLQNLMQELQKGQPNLSVDELEKWKGKLERDYSFMPVEDLNPAKNALAAMEQKIYNARLTNTVGEINSLSSEYASLEKLRRFEKERSMVFYRADAPTRQHAKETIAHRFDEVLAHCLKDEIAVLHQAAEVETLNHLRNDFTKRYATYEPHRFIRDFYEQLSIKKLALVKTASSAIASEIENAVTINQLYVLENKYLSNLNTMDDDTITLLTEKIENRKKEVLSLAEKTDENEKLSKEDMYNLALMYYNGQGVPVDKQAGVEWLEKAAEKNHPAAMHDLASLYQHGEYVNMDIELANQWFEKAAELGNSESQQVLSVKLLDTNKASFTRLPLTDHGSESVYHNLTIFHRPVKSYGTYYDAIIVKPQKPGYLSWSINEELMGSWHIYESKSENFKSGFFNTLRTMGSNEDLITEKTEQALRANRDYLIWFRNTGEDVPPGGIPTEISLYLIPLNTEQESLKDVFKKATTEDNL